MQRNSRLLSFISYAENHGPIKGLRQFFDLIFLKYGLKKQLTINGKYIFLRKNTSDIPTYRQVYIDGDYDIHIPFKPKVIVDLGSNIGLFSTLYAQKFPDATIISLEPFLSNYNVLIENTKSYPNIKPVNAAIWSKDTYKSLVFTPSMGEWGVTVNDSDDDRRKEDLTKCISMSTLKSDFGLDVIDILKIDIEGSEKDLFEVCEPWLYKIRMIIIELHDFIKPGISNNFFKALATIPNFTIDISGENFIVINTDLINQ